MAWAERDAVRIYYEHAGSGPPLLFISGTGGDLRRHPNVFNSPVAETFDVTAFDQRGMGQSDQPPGPYTMADYAYDALAVLDTVRFEKAAVMGVSFGGMVAQELVLRAPERVSRVVLACTSSGGEGGSSYPLHELVGQPRDILIGLTDSRWVDPQYPDPLRQDYVDGLAVTAPQSPGALAQLEARSHHDTWDRLAQITCPVLVAAGRYDGIAPIANAEALVSRIKGARLAVFEGGHMFTRQDPEAYEVIGEFLAEDDAS